MNQDELTERAMREIAYHAQRAAVLRTVPRAVSHDVLTDTRRRWWNHYWSVWSVLLKAQVRGKAALVPGCGEGLDAIRLSMLGTEVCAFDVSPDMLHLAEELAEGQSVRV